MYLCSFFAPFVVRQSATRAPLTPSGSSDQLPSSHPHAPTDTDLLAPATVPRLAPRPSQLPLGQSLRPCLPVAAAPNPSPPPSPLRRPTSTPNTGTGWGPTMWARCGGCPCPVRYPLPPRPPPPGGRRRRRRRPHFRGRIDRGRINGGRSHYQPSGVGFHALGGDRAVSQGRRGREKVSGQGGGRGTSSPRMVRPGGTPVRKTGSQISRLD